MIRWSLLIIASSLVLYVCVGTLIDVLENRRKRHESRAMKILSKALYADHASLGPLLNELQAISNRVLFSIAMHIPLHFDDQLSRRLLDVIGNTAARRKVKRLARSRFWPRRVIASRLAHIVPNGEELMEKLLCDSSSSVRAATIESFGVDQIARFAPELFEALKDRSMSVRFVAQQALLRGDGRLVEPVREALPNLAPELIVRGLEVASNLGDPRLLEAVKVHAESEDPQVRQLVAQATPFGVAEYEFAFFVALLSDEEPLVRVAAVEAVARVQAEWLAGRIGAALRDRSYEVRRAAGICLAQLGAIGLLVLRNTLEGDDAFARDMAQQVLDGLVMDGRVDAAELRPAAIELDSLTDWVGAA